ncbi:MULTISPECIES: DUF924 family protein [Pseudomonas]|uniref:DUF924 domain-containing protein n=1 Tax=Pseudomonas nitroreducens TaxID=46680 RepID=A0A6G6J4L8_PSENT|nr:MULTISPECIES: DUF924 family protein [Pseudomonas]MBG6289773.1 DUF924 domain-containing protein [Pseudomonas nitroreducens]NMZ60705.1 DUF924 domain-containing protein [Pseudomonas nitroreducens]OBY55775.1 hypothetical protein A9513_010980 [Pseudomonas sp. AU12215]QIE90298.1 DUF924 domain-containing protein [Pseudomonas nitroreducens]UCL86662.1 DUF924 domain-containing protein [Pseudomonas sp. HS-18]
MSAAPWQSLLDWWFGNALDANEVAAQRNALWFGKSACQDVDSENRFGGLVRQALDGGLQEWEREPQSWLALILLLDQLPRMIFRDSPRAYAGDARAQQLVRQGLEAGFDRQLPRIERVFVYIVLEHAENLASQNEAVRLYEELQGESSESEKVLFAGYLAYARKHQVVIKRFGRFPHRNAILGRESTVEEVQFLTEPGSRF